MCKAVSEDRFFNSKSFNFLMKQGQKLLEVVDKLKDKNSSLEKKRGEISQACKEEIAQMEVQLSLLTQQLKAREKNIEYQTKLNEMKKELEESKGKNLQLQYKLNTATADLPNIDTANELRNQLTIYENDCQRHGKEVVLANKQYQLEATVKKYNECSSKYEAECKRNEELEAKCSSIVRVVILIISKLSSLKPKTHCTKRPTIALSPQDMVRT